MEGARARPVQQTQVLADALSAFEAQCRVLDLEHHYRTGKPLFPLDDADSGETV